MNKQEFRSLMLRMEPNATYIIDNLPEGFLGKDAINWLANKLAIIVREEIRRSRRRSPAGRRR
jgi:hypothetical protein